MPRLTGNRLPKYRKHASGQAVISLDGCDVYLGPHGTKASRTEYDRVVAEWMANGRSLARPSAHLTINEIAVRYLEYAKGYYKKNGKQTDTVTSIKIALRHVCRTYGRTPAQDFGPLALAAIRDHMIEIDNSRVYINNNVDRIRRMFKWAASQELLPVEAYQRLATVPGLRRGRSAARETAPILPVDDEVFQQTLKFLRPTVADMARIQRLTGCRPAEICAMRPCDVDRSGDIWAYRPESHKTEHHGRQRLIFLGPRAQQVLERYLARKSDVYCFSPAEAEAERSLERRANRVPADWGRLLDPTGRAPPNGFAKSETSFLFLSARHRDCNIRMGSCQVLISGRAVICCVMTSSRNSRCGTSIPRVETLNFGNATRPPALRF